MTRRLVMLVPLALLLVAGAPAAAQQRSHAGLGGGVILPSGDAADFFDEGWGLVVFGRSSYRRSAAGGQLDFQYWNVPGALSSDATDIFAFTFNVVVTFPQREDAKLKFYLLGGIGFYSVNGPVFDTWPFGLNGGGGVELALKGAKTALFADARFHNLFTEGSDVQFLPINAGLKFRVR